MSENKYTIRKLTEKECLRLQGYNDLEIDRLKEHTNEKGKPTFSRSALYRFAGNSVIVDCFAALLKVCVQDDEQPNVEQKTINDWGQ